jgi:uncharacterized membrane protein
LQALSFVWVGISHFTHPETFLAIMPDYIPWHLELVYLSGAFEIAGGLGMLYAPTRRWAGYGLLALLVAVYPANIYMLTEEIYLAGMPHEKWLLWLRMPLQFVMAAVVIWVCELWPRKASTEQPVPEA